MRSTDKNHDRLAVIERDVEAMMAFLRELPSAEPSPDVVARVTSAVLAEAQRTAAARAARRRGAWVAGIAAAAALAVALPNSTRIPALADDSIVGNLMLTSPNADAVLDDWADAASASRATVQALLADDWILDGAAARGQGAGELDDFMRALDALGEIGA